MLILIIVNNHILCSSIVQLAESLQSSNPRVPVDLVVVDKEGICIRYAPLETAQGN